MRWRLSLFFFLSFSFPFNLCACGAGRRGNHVRLAAIRSVGRMKRARPFFSSRSTFFFTQTTESGGVLPMFYVGSDSTFRRNHSITCECACLVASSMHASLSHGQPLVQAHWSTSRCPFLAASVHVYLFHGHPLVRAHCSTSSWPPDAALAHVQWSHSQPLARAHCSTFMWPCSAAISHVHRLHEHPLALAHLINSRWPCFANASMYLPPIRHGAHLRLCCLDVHSARHNRHTRRHTGPSMGSVRLSTLATISAGRVSILDALVTGVSVGAEIHHPPYLLAPSEHMISSAALLLCHSILLFFSPVDRSAKDRFLFSFCKSLFFFRQHFALSLGTRRPAPFFSLDGDCVCVLSLFFPPESCGRSSFGVGRCVKKKKGPTAPLFVCVALNKKTCSKNVRDTHQNRFLFSAQKNEMSLTFHITAIALVFARSIPCTTHMFASVGVTAVRLVRCPMDIRWPWPTLPRPSVRSLSLAHMCPTGTHSCAPT